MKRQAGLVLLLVLLLSLSIVDSSGSQANDWKIVPAERIGDVSLATSVPDLLAALGPPTWVHEVSGTIHRFWTNQLITVTVTANFVDSITTSWFRGRTHPYKTEKGIGIGATSEEVKAAYQDQEVTATTSGSSSAGDKLDILAYPNLGLAFFIQQSEGLPAEIRGRVWAIKVTLPGARSLATPPGFPFTPTRAHDWKIVPGERIGDISLSMSIDEIAPILGTPSQIERLSGVATVYRWDQTHLFNVTILPGRATTAPVDVITTRWLDGRSFPYQTERGIGIKATEQQVREAYRGEALEAIFIDASGELFMLYEKLGINFVVVRRRDVPEDLRGRVWGIQIYRRGGLPK